MPQPPSIPEEVAIWWAGTVDFCQAVQALLVGRLGPGASVPALALQENSVAGNQWLLDSRKAGLEVHELSIRLTESIRSPSLIDSVYSTSPLAA